MSAKGGDDARSAPASEAEDALPSPLWTADEGRGSAPQTDATAAMTAAGDASADDNPHSGTPRPQLWFRSAAEPFLKPRELDHMEPSGSTRMASSHRGQRVGCTVTSTLVLPMLEPSPELCGCVGGGRGRSLSDTCVGAARDPLTFSAQLITPPPPGLRKAATVVTIVASCTTAGAPAAMLSHDR